MARISVSSVRKARSSDRDTYLWDDDLTGFGLKITPAGRKVYLVQYRIGGRKGRTRRVTIGRHGSLTPDQARNEAKAILRLVSRGDDPAETKTKTRLENTLDELIEQFLSEHVDTKLKGRSQSEYRRLISKCIPASLARKPISQIVRADIARLHLSLKETPYQANRVLAVLSKFFNWCEKHGYRSDRSNPAYHVERYKEEQRKRYLSEREIAKLGQTLSEMEREGRESVYIVAAIRLLSLTGARLNEILTLRWDEVDFDRQRLNLSDSKTGTKTVYLNAPALSILSLIPRQEGNPYVICGGKAGIHLINLQKPWRRIRAQAGLDDVRLHDLRHTFASVAVASGMTLPLIGALLGHSQPQTTARYAHLADDPLSSASARVGNIISSNLAPRESIAEQ
jgi:integrase